MYQALTEAFETATTDESVLAVLIRGEGGNFSSGNDLKDFLEFPPKGHDAPVFKFMHAIALCPKPVIAAASRRPIRFVMDHRIFRMPLIGFIFRHMRTIPIAPAREDPAMMEAAFAEVARALAEGELVGIFPEGRITDTGEFYPFRSGIQRIVGQTPVPVIPLALRGLWGSFFSRKDGPAMSKPLRRGLFSKIGLVAGAPVAAQAATPEYLQTLVAELRGDWK